MLVSIQSYISAKILKVTLAVLLFCTIISFNAQSQNLINGDFTNFSGNSVTPAGWTNVEGINPGPFGSFVSVDVLDMTFTSFFGSSTVAASPSPCGGSWVGLSSIPNLENEAIEQSVSGFVIGQTYEVTFNAANFGGTPFDDPGVVTVYVNGIAVAVSPTLNLVANVWTTVTATFVATATTMPVQVDVFHNTGNFGSGGYYSIDCLTIIPSIPPCIVAIAPTLSSTSVCNLLPSFDLNTITANNTPPGTVLSWHSGATANAGNVIANISNVPFGIYYAAFYDPINDCYGPTTLVNINPEPTASFSEDAMCVNNTVNFTNTSTIAGGAIVGFGWDFDNGNTSLIENPTQLFSSAGTYDVLLVVATAQGCVDSVVQQVDLAPIPTPNFSFNGNCLDAPFAFTDASSISAGSILVWNWDFADNGATSSALNPSHTFSAAGSYNVTLTVTSDMGCIEQLTQTVVVSPMPNISFSNVSGCLSDTVFFTNNTTISSGSIAAWGWNLGDGFNSTQQNPNHIYPSAGCFDVTLTANSDQGCISQLMVPNSVCLINLPIAEFFASTTQLDNANQTVVFSNGSANASNYIWNYGDGSPSSNQFEGTHVYDNNGNANYVVTLVASDPAGCSDTFSLTIGYTANLLAYVPNTFTPNNDQLNNDFKPVFTAGFDPFAYSFKVYNRWGENVFESHNSEFGWNGRYGNQREQCQDGTYTWIIEFKTSADNEREKMRGYVNLIR